MRAFDLQRGDRPQHAVHIRLTPALRDALRASADGGDRLSMRLGGNGSQNGVIRVGTKEFGFIRVPEKTCELVTAPPRLGKAGAAQRVAEVRDRIQVQRKLDAKEIDRILSKSKEKNGTSVVRLEKISSEVARNQRIVKVPGRTIIGPGFPGPGTIGPQPSTPTESPKRSPMGPPPARIVDTAQPPKPDAQPKGKGLQPTAPMDQPAPATTRSPPGGSAGRGRGRGGGRTTNALGLLRARKSGKSDPVKCEAAIAAAKVDNTRIVVIALLNEKPYSMKAIQQAVLDSYHQAKQRKIPAKEYILRLVPHLSTFSLAGKYVLKDGLAKEVLAFMEAQPKGEKAEKAPAATAKEPARVGQKRPLADRDKNMKRSDHTTGAAPRVDRSKVPRPGVRKHPQPECPGAPMENSPSATHTERQKKATKRPRLESSAGKDRAPVAPVVDMVETTHSSRERDSDEMMNDHPVPAAADNNHSERRQTNGFSMNNGIPGFLETGDLSKEWFSEFVDRNIEIVPEISSVEEFIVAQAEFQRRYAVYIRLNQLIERNRLHFTTLMGALAASVAEEEQNRLYQQLQDEWTACMQLSLQWDGAFKILHEELGLMRSRLEDFAAIHGSEFVGVDGPERTGLAAGETSRSPT